MPDISMCSNNNCYVKEKCFRHTATPNPYRQIVADFDYDDSQGVCFIPNNKERVKNENTN